MENENIVVVEEPKINGMTKAERKEYNKNYYTNNKSKILEKACEKIECEFCHRKVIKNNLKKHYTSAICKRYSEINIKKYIEFQNRLGLSSGEKLVIVSNQHMENILDV